MQSALTRLIWKEYRAQRLLWMVMVLAAVVIQVIVTTMAPAYDSSFVVVTVIVLCFAAASGSLLFAGEVEERTAGLLRMLPCATRTLMFAKISGMVLGTLAMTVVLTVMHPLVWIVARSLSDQSDVVRGEEVIDTAEFSTLLAGIILVSGCAVLSSLLTRRVLYAIGLAGGFAIIAVFFTGALTATSLSAAHDSTTVYRQLGMITMLGMIARIVPSALLQKPWHLGRLPRSIPMRRMVSDYSLAAPAAGNSIWKHLLLRIASWPASHGRITSMLMWRELRFAIPFGFWWLLAGLVACAGRSINSSGSYTPEAARSPYLWPALLVPLFIYMCGDRTNSDDQRSGASLLLANVGLCPRQVWMAKTASWFAVMLTVSLAIIWMDSIAASLSYSSWSEQSCIHLLIESIRVPDRVEWTVPALGSRSIPGPITGADRFFQYSVVTSFVLALFGSGQLMACWIRRSLIAFAASSLLITAWLIVLIRTAYYYDWPVWSTMTPIAACFFVASACTSRGWLDRVSGWRLRLQQVAWIVLPFVVFSFAGWIVWGLQQ